uniref:Methylmalonic aciduria and homocystinuria type D, mitochondrial n=1 Tax=Lygus hesperus TaxID=30085 RepID=A0A0K8T5W5_LYGHE
MVQRIFKFSRNLKNVGYFQKLFFSRKSSSNQNGSYTIVNRGPENGGDGSKSQLATHSNWELLAPQGYRFYLPGRVGPAWHDEISVSFIPSTNSGFDGTELECSIQDCPHVLRQGINELFPGSESNSNQLTVVSLSQKKEKKASDADIEKLTKQFMWAAQDICNKLKRAGFWADFINPFSGVPFGNPYTPGGLYQTDERFRCLGFHIMEKSACRIITNKINNKFVGSLYTNAPPSTALLRDILKQYE